MFFSQQVADKNKDIFNRSDENVILGLAFSQRWSYPIFQAWLPYTTFSSQFYISRVG
jgi:hypothetical protein